MVLKPIIKKLDHFICQYLGLDVDQILPKRIQFNHQHLRITHTSSFKRHVMQSPWDDYTRLPESKHDEVGFCFGSVIANQLIVSFREPVIKYDPR